MKTNGTQMILVRSVLLVLLCLYFLLVFAHPGPAGVSRGMAVPGTGVPAQADRPALHQKGQLTSLQFFNVRRREHQVELEWALTPQNKVSTVIIERKGQDGTFRPIAQVWVNFDGNQETHFRYRDKQASGKKLYYRLQLVPDSGSVEFSPVIRPDQPAANAGLPATRAIPPAEYLVTEPSLAAAFVRGAFIPFG
ncbi:MAG TPA: hypothetical protein VG870_10935 [Chitinophagaceae bacterium]|nr:hypothetical protein [Chitinophagaceae bacterium]